MGSLSAHSQNGSIKADPNIFLENKHWYSLLLDNVIYLPSAPENPSIVPYPIVFKRDEIKEFTRSLEPYEYYDQPIDPGKHPLIDFSVWDTPSLRVLNKIFEEFAPEGYLKKGKEGDDT